MSVNYNYEYLTLCDKLITGYTKKIEEEYPTAFHMADCSLKVPVQKFLFMQYTFNNQLREEFNTRINTGEYLDDIESRFLEHILGRYSYIESSQEEQPEENRNYFDSLESNFKPFLNKIIYYALHERFLKFALPVLSALPEDVVALCENPIPGDFVCSENIQAIEFSFLKLYQYQNQFLQTKFPQIFFMFNTLAGLWNVLSPQKLIVIEGNHPQFEILALLGKKDKVPVICLQQGWPGILHTGFRNMQYSHFISWGRQFSEMLEALNPIPSFIDAGYPFNVINYEKRNAISFFLQAPLLVSSVNDYNQLLELSFFCAQHFPELCILVREHPEYPLPVQFIETAKKYKNIRLTPPSAYSIDEIYGQSFISVSIFSSTIIESIAHGVIPFVFNPTSMPHYYPDLHQEELGVEVKSLDEAKEKISELINNPLLINQFRERIARRKSEFYTATGNVALQNIVNIILKL